LLNVYLIVTQWNELKHPVEELRTLLHLN
jgi:hypothetical protein